ncbi:MAG: NAD-dependent epimerase/dehydratase family protein [Acidobacteria bacterium]|nr:NAD-dependent epimerase/dehydratase family protein [Acidobacteriota bacterium]MBI3655115.1 NAD-dependent epimerase/dehydratase family protein [Acidobacteriota bacterium]
MHTWVSRKVLVTGGCGFIGSYLVEELVKEGAAVTVVDNLSTGVLSNLAAVIGDVRFIEADLVHFDKCMDACRGMDVVMNLVGKTNGVGYSSSHHGEMLFENTITQLNMLEAARRRDVKRFLVVSSSCVYPDDAPVPTPELPVMAGLPEQANEGYGWAKRIGELQAQFYHRETDMTIAICRPFNPYGGRYAWRGELNSHVVPTLIKKIMDGQNPLVVWGSGKQRRNFLHARDTAKLMMLLTDRYAGADPVNIGYEEDVSVAELVSLMCQQAGHHPEVIFDTSKPEGRFQKCVDATLLRKVTDNYEPKISMSDGIRDMMAWYQQTFKRSRLYGTVS